MLNCNLDQGLVVGIWSNIRNLGSTSSTSAIIASYLAKKNNKVLLFSSDIFSEINGPSLCTNMTTPGSLDDIVLLFNANGISDIEEIKNYTTSVTENLDIIKTNPKGIKNQEEFYKGIEKLLKKAKFLYDYVVLDIKNGYYPFLEDNFNNLDILILNIPQNFKAINDFNTNTTLANLLENKATIINIPNYIDFKHLNKKKMCKLLKIDDLSIISIDEELNKAIFERYVTEFITKLKANKYSTLYLEVEDIFKTIKEAKRGSK